MHLVRTFKAPEATTAAPGPSFLKLPHIASGWQTGLSGGSFGDFGDAPRARSPFGLRDSDERERSCGRTWCLKKKKRGFISAGTRSVRFECFRLHFFMWPGIHILFGPTIRSKSLKNAPKKLTNWFSDLVFRFWIAELKRIGDQKG